MADYLKLTKEETFDILDNFNEHYAAFNDIEALKSSVNTIENIVAIMVEPIQGEGGIVIPNKNYLKTIRSICDKNNLLMIVDEVQTGMCRTGKWFEIGRASCRERV